MTDQDLMPFGKYKHERMEDVPASYLLWLYDDMREQGDHKTGFNTPQRKNLFEYLESSYTALQKECDDYDSKYKPGDNR